MTFEIEFLLLVQFSILHVPKQEANWYDIAEEYNANALKCILY